MNKSKIKSSRWQTLIFAMKPFNLVGVFRVVSGATPSPSTFPKNYWSLTRESADTTRFAQSACRANSARIPARFWYAEACFPKGFSRMTTASGRPKALEPILIGWLIAPNGEIREHLPIETAPQVLLSAIIAAEDDAFYEHGGVNYKGAARATGQHPRWRIQSRRQHHHDAGGSSPDPRA